MRTTFLSCLVPLAIMVFPSLARAEDPTHDYPACDHQASDSDVQAAKGAFQAGQVSFDEADYQRAITYWEDAYRRDCTAHALLLNLSRAYELSGRKQQAVVALDTYLARNQAAADKDKIQRRVDVLKAQIAAEQPAQPQPTPTPVATQPVPPPDAGTAEAPGGKRKPLPLYVAAAGGAVGLISLFPYLNARSDVDDYEAQCGGTRGGCPNKGIAEAANSARTRESLFGALTLVGFGTGIGGLIWYFASPKVPPAAPTAAAPPRVTPTAGPGFAGLVVDGRF